jgi:hypothetical protein
MTRKPRLTDLDLVLLSNAANRPDGMLLPPPDSLRGRGKTLEKTLAKLLRLNLVEEVPTLVPDQVWRHDDDGGGFALRIAAAGRTALGFDGSLDAPGDAASQTDTADEAAQAKGNDGAAEATADTDAETPANAAPFTPGVKPGTKQALLVDRLNQPAGASIADLGHLLGWQPHTVRAALTGLRQKGYRVTRTRNDDGGTVYRAATPAKVFDDAA